VNAQLLAVADVARRGYQIKLLDFIDAGIMKNVQHEWIKVAVKSR
jgi:hypothetical protein